MSYPHPTHQIQEIVDKPKCLPPGGKLELQRSGSGGGRTFDMRPVLVDGPFAEQHRIATCLSSLDDLIAAQSDRISALQTHKQGLLQQIFPSTADIART